MISVAMSRVDERIVKAVAFGNSFPREHSTLEVSGSEATLDVERDLQAETPDFGHAMNPLMMLYTSDAAVKPVTNFQYVDIQPNRLTRRLKNARNANFTEKRAIHETMKYA